VTGGLEEKKVVTCFLESGGKVLLLRRSEKVGSYRGKWAGVSGYLESGPEGQAYTEIKEETGLAGTDVELVRTGEPLVIEDADLATCWIVHPFLFHVKQPEKIRMDWEHKESRWIDPADIGNYDTVPRLGDTLARVVQAGGCTEVTE
jgi:8-oxo-dGTP diphosphatase